MLTEKHCGRKCGKNSKLTGKAKNLHIAYDEFCKKMYIVIGEAYDDFKEQIKYGNAK